MHSDGQRRTQPAAERNTERTEASARTDSSADINTATQSESQFMGSLLSMFRSTYERRNGKDTSDDRETSGMVLTEDLNYKLSARPL